MSWINDNNNLLSMYCVYTKKCNFVLFFLCLIGEIKNNFNYSFYARSVFLYFNQICASKRVVVEEHKI